MTIQEMKTPYASLIAKKDNPSKAYYMLAELIDNSISSWEKGGEQEELEINITINNEESEIIIDDNAEGMKKEELENAIRLHEVSTTKNGLNMFGVGLKNAAFWFAQDLIIKTRTRDGLSSETSVIISEIDDLKKTVEWEAVESDKEDRGTCVIFRNVYSDKKVNPTNFKDVVSILGFKYDKYLETGRVKITLKHIIGGNRDIVEEHLTNVKLDSVIIPTDQVKKFEETLKKEYDETKLLILTNLKEQVIKKVRNNEQLKLNFDVHYDFQGKSEILEFEFGVLGQESKKDFSKYAGLTTYQHNRAINLPPSTTLPLKKEIIRSNMKRVFGKVELGNLFKPDNNKTQFSFGEHEEYFFDLIDKIGKELAPLADAVFITVSGTDKVKKTMRSDTMTKLQTQLNHKSKVNWKISSEDSQVTLDLNDGTKIVAIIKEVSTVDRTSNDFFINAKAIPNEENKFEITYNVEHMVWKPLSISEVISTIDSKTVIYPLVAIIGLTTVMSNANVMASLFDKSATDVLELLNGIANIVMD